MKEWIALLILVTFLFICAETIFKAPFSYNFDYDHRLYPIGEIKDSNIPIELDQERNIEEDEGGFDGAIEPRSKDLGDFNLPDHDFT